MQLSHRRINTITQYSTLLTLLLLILLTVIPTKTLYQEIFNQIAVIPRTEAAEIFIEMIVMKDVCTRFISVNPLLGNFNGNTGSVSIPEMQMLVLGYRSMIATAIQGKCNVRIRLQLNDLRLHTLEQISSEYNRCIKTSETSLKTLFKEWTENQEETNVKQDLYKEFQPLLKKNIEELESQAVMGLINYFSELKDQIVRVITYHQFVIKELGFEREKTGYQGQQVVESTGQSRDQAIEQSSEQPVGEAQPKYGYEAEVALDFKILLDEDYYARNSFLYYLEIHSFKLTSAFRERRPEKSINEPPKSTNTKKIIVSPNEFKSLIDAISIVTMDDTNIPFMHRDDQEELSNDLKTELIQLYKVADIIKEAPGRITMEDEERSRKEREEKEGSKSRESRGLFKRFKEYREKRRNRRRDRSRDRSRDRNNERTGK